MTTYLFDASSLLMLAKRHPDKASMKLSGEHILDLTIYEIGNAVWKINRLLKNTDESKAVDSMGEAHHLTSIMKVERIQGLQDLKKTMENAYRYNLNFYDSAYLTAAGKHGLILVTEDKQLAKKGKDTDTPIINIEAMIETS